MNGYLPLGASFEGGKNRSNFLYLNSNGLVYFCKGHKAKSITFCNYLFKGKYVDIKKYKHLFLHNNMTRTISNGNIFMNQLISLLAL